MHKSKFKIILLILLVSSVFSILLFSNIAIYESYNEDTNETDHFYDLTISGPEINITTPENKTYTTPMSGYYPASFGFENDENGENPYGIDVSSEANENIEIQVIDGIDNHYKVVEVDDQNNTDGWPGVYLTSIFPVSFGTLEYWIRFESLTDGLGIDARDSLNNLCLSFFIESGKWKYKTSYLDIHDMPNVPNPQDNTWIHVRVDFRCKYAPTYLGISQETYIVFINGISSGEIPFRNSGEDIANYAIVSIPSVTAKFWVDAIGYSWDPDYSIGDNIYEGLLLNFEPSFIPNWIGYSLDAQANRTIMGNTTIPFPSPGIHNIQIFGNNSIGEIFESDIKYFSISGFKIITPENKTYIGAMNGYYPATYGFENDVIGGNALDWDDSASDSNCGSQVIAEKNGHHNVIEIYDNNGGSKARLNNHFVDQSYGTVELWFCPGDATNGGVVRLMDIDLIENRAYLRLLNDHWYSYDGSVDTLIPNVPDPQDNVWQHIKIHFESTSGGYQGLSQYTYKVIINGVSSGSIPFYTNGGSIDTFNIFTGNAATTTRWIDAVSYSWDLSYTIGDNKYEGLLLSYENNTNYEWIGYSLDNQPSKTILGNETIPMPENGVHSIQLFGNDSLGVIYNSEIRYLTIDISILISINSPQVGAYFGYNAPNFDLIITTARLNYSWYTLNNGVTNISFTTLSGTIEQLEWQKYGHGPITIKFYANNTYGQKNHAEITINKDLNPPTSTLSFVPYSGFNIVKESTVFTLTANDFSGSGVSIIRYKINDSGWLNYTGPFTLSGFSKGDYLITYQSIDEVGNIESEQSIVVELYQIPEPPKEFPMELIIIIITSALIGIVLIGIFAFTLQKRRKSRIFVEEKKPQILEQPQRKRTKTKTKKEEVKPLILNCPFCQAELPGDQKFCYYCGAKLEE